ncbi:DNA topoisomerase IB [Agromyces mediolanus]|uniref:DNA topoisomerase IB n=1 Tax=Agromyces mediolanus TaxID=41986 RepID=UPI003835567B
MPRLRRVQPYVSPGYRRRRRGAGFEYRHVDGGLAGSAERRRIEDLAIPPAWTEVWIADAPNAHILAVGVDAAGRRQYRYHPAWRERQDAEKFERMVELARVLPDARRSVRRQLGAEGRGRERALAAAFRTLDLGALRVGGEEYLLAARTRGLTTLLIRNATVDGELVRLRFRAKGGALHRIELEDAGLVGFVVSGADARPSSRLFSWRAEDAARSALRAITASEVNDDIRERTGGDFTAKDFRTLRGTLVAAERLAAEGAAGTARARNAAIREAYVAASEVLRNTPTIAKSSYVDPRVVRAYEAGLLLEPSRRPEAALVALLERELIDEAG